MRAMKVFFLGLVFGWLVKWMIDEIFNEDNLRIITNENALLQERIRTLEAPKSLEAKSVQRTASAPPAVERPQPSVQPEPAQRTRAGMDRGAAMKDAGQRAEQRFLPPTGGRLGGGVDD